MKNLTKQKGFTLIELVVVIVILGILAVTAAPKFIDLTGDARKSVMEAVKGSINSAADMAHAKALVLAKTSGAISVAGTTITLINSWPDAATIAELLELDADISHSAGTFEHADAADGSECSVTYASAASSTARPEINIDTDDCN
jgi:MSHA pilin protein MshA